MMADDNTNVVTIFNENGSVSQYARLSGRIPEFLNKFPPEENYRVESKMADLLSMQPARLSLVREAISIGKRPEELGLPIAEDLSVMICTCSLYGPNGDLISNRHASKPIEQYKDLEVLETAAFQRLIASLGFGGEIFDEDENTDITAQGNNVESLDTTTVSSQKDLPAPAALKSAPSFQSTSSNEKKTEAIPTTELDVSEASPDEPIQDDVPPALRRQVENLANSLSVDIPSMKTVADAQTAMMDLNKQVRELRKAT